jgi:hypothetical protein
MGSLASPRQAGLPVDSQADWPLDAQQNQPPAPNLH